MSKLKDYIKVYKKYKAKKERDKHLIKKKYDKLGMQDKKAYIDMLITEKQYQCRTLFSLSFVGWVIKLGIGFLLFSLLMSQFDIDMKMEALQIFSGLLELSLYLLVFLLINTLISVAMSEHALFKLKKKLLNIK